MIEMLHSTDSKKLIKKKAQKKVLKSHLEGRITRQMDGVNWVGEGG